MTTIQLSNKKSIVTGVSGFLGGNLANALLDIQPDADVLGVSRMSPSRFVRDAVRHHALDLNDFDSTHALLKTERPEVVYHLAASSVLQAASVEGGVRAMLETNVRATWNLLEACRRVETPVVVVASSDKQYGALAAPPYDDDDTTAFANGGVYELSKAQQDQVARLFAGLYDLPAVRVARLANIYGPGDIHWTRIVPGTIRRAVVGEAPTLTAGRAGESLREYVFVADAVAALLALAADARATGNESHRRPDGKLARVGVNIGSGHHHAAGDVISTIRRLLHDEYGIESPEPILKQGLAGVFEPGSQHNKLDKLRRLLPTYTPLSLENGLRQTLPWYLSHLQSANDNTTTNG